MAEGLDLVIHGGTVVTPDGVAETDVEIAGGRIARLGRGLPAAETVDARGLLVLPGGVDAHCHIDQMTSTGARTADDFHDASVGAAFGGTTTLIAFAAQHRGQRLAAVVEDYRARAEGRAVVDYGFHMIVTDAGPRTVEEDIPALVAQGFTSIKIYLTYDALKLADTAALDVMLAARRLGAMTMVHAESHDIIAWLTSRMLASGHGSLRHYPFSRPALAERDATHHAITLAELVETPIVVVHVSSAEALEQIRWARARGQPIFAETCPQYLTLTADDLDRQPEEAVKFCCSPPMRDEDSQDALWRGMAEGAVSLVSSDHSAFRMEGPEGKLRAGPDPAFNQVPYGLPGIEARLPLVFSEGVSAGRIGIERFVELTSTAPARLYGLAGRKGVIAPGADADIALWDAKARRRITAADLHDGVGYTPYEGRDITGWPVATFVRGKAVMRDGQLLARPGHGRLLARNLPGVPARSAPDGRRRFDVMECRMID